MSVNIACNYIINILVSQRPDKKGKEPKLVLWQHPGNDVTGMVARSRKVAETCQEVKKMNHVRHLFSEGHLILILF